MTWLFVSIISYLIFAFVFLIDKYLLSGPIPNPKIYAFYLGVLAMLVLLLIPFVGFYIPEPRQIFLSLAAGAFFVYAIFWFLKTLSLFEAFQTTAIIGGLTPLFTLVINYIFSSEKGILSFREGVAFLTLVLGTIIISFEIKDKEDANRSFRAFNLKSFGFSAITALLFSIYYVLLKYVFLEQSFWNGTMWMRFGGLLVAVSFLFFHDVRQGIKFKKIAPKGKIFIVFIANQAAGAGANILISWAVALAPVIYISFINALQGIQYVFLLILTFLISKKYPNILKNEAPGRDILRKIIGALLIVFGIFLISLKR